MSYQVLARKWRPKNFKEMVGQEAILRILTNALDQNRLHHAYLFTGTRGVGKTTLGRILAKCLNCEAGVTSTPCGQCATCIAIDNGTFLDLYEIDAASYTKVEGIREILSNALYAPTSGRYKVYLIDEAHMLSTHSFNALLKTLEEPPAHVKFLLATTEVKKIPITILSRCLQFYLKRISPEQIAPHLQFICDTEHYKYDVEALALLAKAAEGSMRDGLSLLDQAIAFGNGNILLKETREMLGSIMEEEVVPLLEALANQNGAALFATIDQLAAHAPDYAQLLEVLISYFHQIALIQILPDEKAPLSIQTLAKRLMPQDVQVYYQIALLGRRDLAFHPTPRQGFEMILLRMLAFLPEEKQTLHKTPIKPIDAPVKQSVSIKSTEADSPVIQSAPISQATVPTPPPATPPQPAAESPAQPACNELSDWRDAVAKLELTGMAYALASNCTFVSFSDHKVKLALSINHEPMLNQKLKERINEALNRHLKQSVQLEINVTTGEIFTPIKQQKQEQDEKLAQATQQIMQNAQIKNFIDHYDATVEVSLIA